eukprot:SAG22_NODE_292_length_12914_cov_41.306594_2_plen_149_part_00
MEQDDDNTISIRNFSTEVVDYWLDGGVESLDELEFDELYSDSERAKFEFYIILPSVDSPKSAKTAAKPAAKTAAKPAAKSAAKPAAKPAEDYGISLDVETIKRVFPDWSDTKAEACVKAEQACKFEVYIARRPMTPQRGGQIACKAPS